MVEGSLYTIREAAFLAEQPVEHLEKAAERGEIILRPRTPENRFIRLSHSDVVFCRFFLSNRSALPKQVWPSALSKFRSSGHRLIKIQVVEGELTLTVDLRTAEKRIRERAKQLKSLKKIAKDDEDSVIKGTDIPLYRVAALVGADGDRSRAQFEFPSLSVEDIDHAVTYARLYPKRGRPYPATGLKETLGGLSALLQDDEDDV